MRKRDSLSHHARHHPQDADAERHSCDGRGSPVNVGRRCPGHPEEGNREEDSRDLQREIESLSVHNLPYVDQAADEPLRSKDELQEELDLWAKRELLFGRGRWCSERWGFR